MTQPQKFPFPGMPYRYPPYPYPYMMPDKNKMMMPGMEPNMPPNLNSTPIPEGQGGPPFMPPRFMNPYYGGYNMFPMPQPFPPYMPMPRNNLIPPPLL